MKGFTLIELLVVVSITILLSGLIVSFSSTSEEQTNLYVQTAKVIQEILRARSFAVTAYLPAVSEERVCGHGFYVNSAKKFALVRYIRNCPNGVENCPAGNGPPNESPLCRQIGETDQNIDKYIRVVYSTGALEAGAGFDLNGFEVRDIIFRPPNPRIFFYDRSGRLLSVNETDILLQGARGLKIRLTVGQGGQISYKFE